MLLGLTLVRRAQLMVYRMVGTSRATLGAMLSIENGCAILIGAALAVPVAWIGGMLWVGTPFAAVANVVGALHVGSAAATAIAVYLCGSLLIVGGDPIRAMRER